MASPTTNGSSVRSPVLINEIVAAGQRQVADEDGEYHDWIELHNRSSQTVNLLGWSLTDDELEPDKWLLPDVNLPPGGYLLLFASDKNRPRSVGSPKDIPTERLSPPAQLHSNFKLAAEGGYLALRDNTSRRFRDAHSIRYLQQFEGLSYGLCHETDGECYMAMPTPGQANDETTIWQGVAAPVTASVPHGFYDQPFKVDLTTATDGATIWYTTDGSEPGEDSGSVYTGPLQIARTTILRARAGRPGYLAATPATFSYIFPEDVRRQGENPPGYPATWGTYRGDLFGFAAGAPVSGNYGLDPEVVEDPLYRDRIRASLLSLPSLSLVTDVDNLDIYFEDPLARGIEAERPVSVEWLDPTGAIPGFQTNAGLRIQGKLGRSELTPKHSFRLLFRQAYGAAQLEHEVFPNSPVTSFDVLVLRAGSHENFAGYVGEKQRLSTYAKDEWLRRSQMAASGVGARGRFLHLYLNGLYWGVYNLVERPDASFATSYFGGDKNEWLSAKPGGADEDILCRIEAMRRLAEGGRMADPARYAAMLEFVDPVQFIDYVLLHWYAGAEDSFENNWYLAMQEPDSPFQFFAWDGELSWLNGAQVLLGQDGKEDRLFPNFAKPLFNALILNPDFRLTLADRMYKHTSAGGALSDAAAIARWLEITGELEEAMIAESARWGDTWFEPPITLEDWQRGRDRVLGHMDGNVARLLAMARTEGFYPAIDPPAFSQGSGSFAERMHLTMDAAGGDIYYTLDGSDPRVQVTGEVNPAAQQYVGPIEMTHMARVRARILKDGVWSALAEADYQESGQPSGLRITELMYNPQGGDNYEYFEVTNVGDNEVDLSGAVFEGIDLRFAHPTVLAGGATMVLAANEDAFREHYAGAPLTAVYQGELSDSGETIVLRGMQGEALLSFSYDDEHSWPLTADGHGDALVLADLTGDMSDRRSWQTGPAAPGTGGWTPAVLPAATPAANLPADFGDPQPSHPTNIRFGDDLWLAGYDVYLNAQPLSAAGLPVVQPSDVLEYVLYWQRTGLAGKEAYVELIAPDGHVLEKVIRFVGLLAQPQTTCFNAGLVFDRFTVQVPAGAANGLIQPAVHIYVPESGVRLDASSSEGQNLGDAYRLPALKIIDATAQPAPEHQVAAQFGESIELLGYTLDRSGVDLQAGQTLTATLYYRAHAPIDDNLTRFLQLYSQENGMAAQNDSEPAGGGNPTWTWQPGEVIVDEVVLTVSPEAASGDYMLLVGFYEPTGLVRAPVTDGSGKPVAGAALPLTKVVVTAGEARSRQGTTGGGASSP